ncbi:MAG: zinc ribbon domain-containing protein [Sphaerochaetaceae bacterium]|nr:zinc ribbon domain-containing protein [Sphaerochaetaceae bacterium]
MKKGISSTIVIIIIGMVLYSMFFDGFKEMSFFSFIPFIGFIYIIKSITNNIKKEQNEGNSDVAKNDFVDSFLKPKTNQNKSNKTSIKSNENTENLGRGISSKRCKKCYSLISSDDRYCPECGAPQKNTIICEYCGHENPASNALCEKCNGFL